jgi:arginase
MVFFTAMKKTIEIIGVPSDLGANLRGANIGPAALRICGLKEAIEGLGYPVIDSGDISVPVRETLKPESVNQKFLKEIVEVCSRLKEKVGGSLKASRLPIVIGGDHSLAIGSLSGVSEHFESEKSKFGLIWIDAHADMNTPQTSPSFNIHGMPFSVLLGNGYPELVGLGGKKQKLASENVALVGIRILDPKEKEVLKACGVRYFTMRQIDEKGMFSVMKEAIEIASRGTKGIHVSFDLDVIDPSYAPGVSWPYRGGLSYREAHLAMEMVADTGLLSSLDFVELNPFTDEQNRTAKLTVELIQSALGKSIV